MSSVTRRILVTGANGFIGSAVLRRLVRDGLHRPVAAVRRADPRLPPVVEAMLVGDLAEADNWSTALRGVDVVVHAAARVHVMRDTELDPLSEFRRVNLQGTLNIARRAVAAGVSRFVFLSSIKVNGESTEPGRPFTSEDAPAPQDPYGVSKAEAEDGLRALARETGLEVVIIRPPLVYGPGVKANFLSMMRWVNRGIPLPLAGIHNKRSMVGLDNLVDLIVACADHAGAPGKTFLAADAEDLSTTELLQRVGGVLGRPARLFPVPEPLLASLAKALGKGPVVQRLFGSLQVDSSAARHVLGWKPPVSVDEALTLTARHFLGQGSE